MSMSINLFHYFSKCVFLLLLSVDCSIADCNEQVQAEKYPHIYTIKFACTAVGVCRTFMRFFIPLLIAVMQMNENEWMSAYDSIAGVAITLLGLQNFEYFSRFSLNVPSTHLAMGESHIKQLFQQTETETENIAFQNIFVTKYLKV